MIRKPHITKKPPAEMLSKRRLIENEALARKANERVQKAVEETFPAKERTSLKLHFYCECADAKCDDRITMSPDEYKKIHRDRRRFIAKPNHEVKNIERIVEKQPGFEVIEKVSFSRVRRLLNVRHKVKKLN